MKALVIAAIVALAGCATCRENPVGCAIVMGAVVVAGYEATHHDHNQRPRDITAHRCTVVNPTTGMCP
jgi:hypothetical protein